MFLRKLKYLLVIGIFMVPGLFSAQEKGYLRTKKISTNSDTIVIDTLSLVPGKIKLFSSNGNLLDSSFYKVDHVKGTVVFDKLKMSKDFAGDSIAIFYQTFPFSFSREYKHKDMSNIRPGLYGKNDLFVYKSEKGINNDLFKTDGLNKSGSISRGISFGNNQDVVVNSNLNLQLSGKLNNNIDILMAATDNNIPIQPDGNTQQLQEFDKVFIQLSDSKTKLTAGDFQLLRPNSYFMNYNKKAQGLNVASAFEVNPMKKSFNKVMASGAVSKGKFARNQVQGVERNQGPYKLHGSENETYIIILSGTEKVYLDGQLLQRGQENDYVIDYNTAEIRFTPKNLITKDKRITVEFQYSDKNYARSLVQFSDEFEQGKLKLRMSAYSEQDAKNQPLQQQLSQDQKLLLTNVGDSIQYAVTPSIDSVPYTNTLVLYLKKDSINSLVLYKDIYVYSTDSSKAHYKLSFSYVGQGKGNYNQINSGANGKVFQWVAPVSGIMQGAYEPVVLLVAPKKKQMLAVSGEYNFSKQSKVSMETAMSSNDINTFSKLDKSDNTGYALKFNFDNVKPFSAEDTVSKKQAWKLISNVNYELVQNTFSAIERFRSIEFDRDWNRSNTIAAMEDQHIIGGTLSIAKQGTGSLGYRFNSFLEGTNYNGLKHGINAGYTKHGFVFAMDGSLLNSTNTIGNTNFIRSKATLSKKIKRINIGINEQQEKNQFKDKNTDALQLNSYEFYEWETFVNNADTSKSKIGVSYKQRTDYGVKQNTLAKSAFAENVGLNVDLSKNSDSQFRGSVTYRTLKITDSLITAQKPDDALISRLEYDFGLLRGFIFSNTYYEIGSGLEAKKEFSYLQVAVGQGVYEWIDYNNNGVKELNEFEIAAFKSNADYIRVYTPTNNYIKTYTNQFSEVLNIKPAAIWANKNGFRKIISRLGNQTAYRVDRKTSNDNLEVAYNPFLQETRDSSLTALNSSFRNTIFINQMGSVFGMDLSYQDNRNKLLLTYGNDSRVNTFKESRIRWNFTNKFSLNMNGKMGIKYSNSQYFVSKNYQINYNELEPKLNYQPNTSFRFSLSFKYTEKQNSPDYGLQQALLNNYGAEIRYNALQKGSLNVKINFIQIKYNDTENSSLAFEMLEGLKIGQNATWSVLYQRNLSNNMQIGITYDGRVSGNNKPVHTGGMQVRAYF